MRLENNLRTSGERIVTRYIDVLNSSFDGFLVYLVHYDEILEVCLKILVEVRSTSKQKMDIEGIPSFHMTAIEKSLTFLKQQIVRTRGGDDFFWSVRNCLTIWVSNTFPPMLVRSMLKRAP
jgi:hypothetical protein